MVILSKIRRLHAIAYGAEAIIEKQGPNLLKNRVKKGYRLKQIDEQIRKFRTKREVKILESLSKAGIKVPNVLDKSTYSFVMENLAGKKVRDVLDEKPTYTKKIGKIVGEMHDLDIVHGDLTTSNMIFFNKQMYLIDFGLSSFSIKLEDKAVDIHLFKQALESKHHKVYKKALANFLKGYNPNNKAQILSRLEKVEGRGRYKQKF